MPTQRHKTTIQHQSKFVSKDHIGYSENVALEILQESQYCLQNITQMQVADVQIALQICRASEINENKTIQIHTLDKAIKDIKEQGNPPKTQDESQSLLKKYENIHAITPPNKTQEILDLRAKMTKLALDLCDKNTKQQDITAILQQIKDILKAYQKQDTLFNIIKDVDFSHTEKAFSNAKKTLDEIVASLDSYTEEAKKDFENRFNKDMIALSAHIIQATHSPLLAHILAHKVGTSVAKRLLLTIVLGSAALGPFGITISIVFVLLDIYDFFANKKKENEKLKAAYEVYGVIASIYERLDYSLASLINFGHIGAGNLITTQRENSLIYYLYPDYTQFHSAFLRLFLKDNTLNHTDISYKATLSFYNQKVEQSYLKNIFNHNNFLENTALNTKTIKTQFSTFSFEHVCKIYEKDKDNNFTHSSAFAHLRNMLLGFDNFLFIKSSSFSSLLAADMLMQSFAPSRQQDTPRINKTALILTNCLHNGSPQYQVQQYIKDKIFHHENMKKNILFLSAMYRVKKTDFVAKLIDTLTKLFNKLEQYTHRNETQQARYLTQSLGALIKRYDVGDVQYDECVGYVKSYQMSDEKLCNINERDFCSFVYDLCRVFVTKQHVSMSYDYMKNERSKNYPYPDSQEKLQQAKAEIQETLQSITAIIADIGKLFSHFDTYELNRLKEYNDQIQAEYEKQKGIVDSFFNTQSFQNKQNEKQPNIFCGIQETQKIQGLCIAVLDKYFNKKGDTKDLDSLLQSAKNNIKILESERALEQSNKVAYYQITKECVIPLLPLDASFFNCLEEEDIFVFSRYIIEQLRVARDRTQNTQQDTTQDKNRQKAIADFVIAYEMSIRLYVLFNDGDFEKLYYESMVENHNKTMQNIIEAFCVIAKNTSRDIAKDTLADALKKKIGDKYGVIPAIAFGENTQKILQEIGSNIANELDNPYTKHLPSTNLPKNFKRLSFVANAAISYASQAILDKIFPTHIGSVREMKQQAIALLFALNRHTNTPYATCKQGSQYLTFPIEITQTLISADLQAMILGGSALDSGLCVHTPSVGIFNENKANTLKTLKETLRHFMNTKVNFSLLDGKKRTIVKEAYAKLWYYLDMGENKEIESYLRNKVCTKPSYCTLDNLTSDAYIRTKLKKVKHLNNDDENFIEIKGDKTGGLRFNHDFLIQLKRVAEWNYGVYTEKIMLQEEDDEHNQGAQQDPQQPQLCGNLIYNEGYIPTTIDIKD